jgi:serine/threonine protein kinase
MERYKLGKLLGQGAFGAVYKIKDRNGIVIDFFIGIDALCELKEAKVFVLYKQWQSLRVILEGRLKTSSKIMALNDSRIIKSPNKT